MKILITGSTGLLGQALVRRLAASGEVVGVSRHAPARPHPGTHRICDLTDAAATQRLLQAVRPHVVIHAQAISDVDRCELEPREAEQFNVQTVEHLCGAAQRDGPLLIAMSTDYVFDGAKGSPYLEADEPRPLSVYGKSKLAGEQVALRYPRGVVVRPSTLFGRDRMNFCDTIVERCRQGQTVEAFVDQRTSPTYTEDLAEGLQALLEALGGLDFHRAPRLYHMTNQGACTRVEFARRVVGLIHASEACIHPIQIHEQRRPAPRPACSALSSTHLSKMIGRMLRPWEDALSAYLASRGWSRPTPQDQPMAPPRSDAVR